MEIIRDTDKSLYKAFIHKMCIYHNEKTELT